MFLAESPSVLRARLTKLNEEMDVLEARLRFLAAERRRVIQDLDSIVYPVLTLPPEITAHIFSYYVDNPHIGYTRSPGRGPLVLAGVCREWRNICLSVGALWASLRVYERQNLDLHGEDLLSFIRCWLSRAGRQPLDLQIFGAWYTSEIFSAISDHSPQFRTLRFALALPSSFPNAEIRGRIPSLMKLVVTILDIREDESVLLTAFSDAPCLREAQLSGASLQWLSLPWVQLTHLELSDDSLSEYVGVLRQTPNLEVLRVSITHIQDAADPSSTPLILPNLHTLEFSYDREGMLLSYLTLPALRTLELTSLPGANSFLLHQAGLRSAWPLRSMRLTRMASEAVVICLDCLPTLETVEICNPQSSYYDWEPIIAAFAHHDEFLPALRTLVLCGSPSHFSITKLVEMLASRWDGNRQGVIKLASFRLKYGNEAAPNDPFEELRTRLRSLTNEGLNVVLG
ncbi:hypothetical protein FB451DRAFT_1034989 [Mycena latifolia]|nr:hypothetical protein FB451DRAFT_1034989 [Mycena latifolia]